MPYVLGSSPWLALGEWSTEPITVPAYTYTGRYTRVNSTWNSTWQSTTTNATTYSVNVPAGMYTYTGTWWTPLGTLREGDVEEPTPEVVAARARDRAARIRRSEERELARVTAIRRADDLLLSLLSEEQQQAYRLDGSFEVIGSAGGRYRINQGSVGNVEWIDEHDRAAGRLCAHPDMYEDWLPDGDVALAQLLALTTDERAFLGVANVHAGRRPPLLERAA